MTFSERNTRTDAGGSLTEISGVSPRSTQPSKHHCTPSQLHTFPAAHLPSCTPSQLHTFPAASTGEEKLTITGSQTGKLEDLLEFKLRRTLPQSSQAWHMDCSEAKSPYSSTREKQSLSFSNGGSLKLSFMTRSLSSWPQQRSDRGRRPLSI